MDWGKVLDKGSKGLLTMIAALILANIPALQNAVVNILPEGIDPQMTIAGAIGAIIVALANIIKHAGKK